MNLFLTKQFYPITIMALITFCFLILVDPISENIQVVSAFSGSHINPPDTMFLSGMGLNEFDKFSNIPINICEVVDILSPITIGGSGLCSLTDIELPEL